MVRSPRVSIFTFSLMLASVGAFSVAACGGTTPPPEDPAASAADPEAAPGDDTEAAVHFDDMKKGEQIAYMKKVVLPQMAKSFQEVAPDRFADMGCATCHGSGAKNGHFEMPNPELPKLDPTNSFAAHMETAPDMTRFMMEKVVPEMAQMLGEAPFDPATGEGFGCFECHTKK